MVLGVDVNLVAVLVAAIATMIVGSIWYGPLFGKTWMRLSGMTKDDQKKMKMTAMRAMIMGFVVALITAYIIGVIVGLANASTIGKGAMVGFWVWLGIGMPIHAGVYLWEGKPLNLFILNTIQYLITIVISASILAIW